MGEADLARLLAAAEALPALMVTLAPESASTEQISALAAAGVVVSLGHSDCSAEEAQRAVHAGARCVTHLFNAMSQMGNREPGLVGAALASGGVHAGLIADAVHVHPAVIRAAWDAKTGPGRIFLVSDAMAVAGTDGTAFDLGGRRIERRDGRLTLADGTLAGADLDLTTAIGVLVNKVGIAPEIALQAATTVPAALISGRRGGFDLNLVPVSGLIRIEAGFSEVSPLV